MRQAGYFSRAKGIPGPYEYMLHVFHHLVYGDVLFFRIVHYRTDLKELYDTFLRRTVGDDVHGEFHLHITHHLFAAHQQQVGKDLCERIAAVFENVVESDDTRP